jgi:hypothetical protein
VIFGALQVTKVLSTEEAKRAIEGSGKDFGKSNHSHALSKAAVKHKNRVAYSAQLQLIGRETIWTYLD